VGVGVGGGGADTVWKVAYSSSKHAVSFGFLNKIFVTSAKYI
jgi:hypothetical protein